MANHKSALKSIRQIEKRTEIVRSRMNRVRTFVKKVQMAIQEGNKESATVALKLAESEIARAAQKGMLAKSTASRKVSRLCAAIKKIA